MYSRFQTACANYFLCNEVKFEWLTPSDRFKPLARIISSATSDALEHYPRDSARFKPLARIISSATRGRHSRYAHDCDVSNRLRELFPLQRMIES